MNRLSHSALSILAGLALASSASAQYGYSPTYTPTVSIIQGNQPLIAGSTVLSGSDPVAITISLPSTANYSNVVFPLTVTLLVTIPANHGANPGVPIGGDAATALGYCTLSSYSVQFNDQTSTASVTASVNVPAGVVAGNYYWNIKGTDWPAGWSDLGATINANVLPPQVNATVLPVISNLLPATGTNFVFDGTNPVPVPISFTATCGPAASGGSKISSLAAQFDSQPLVLTTSGIGSTNPDGTFSASGSVTPSISNSGPHTITVSAVNGAGTTPATTLINVVVPAKLAVPSSTTLSYHQLGSIPITVIGWPAPTVTVTGLPAWASYTYNSTSGAITISGTPTAAGSTSVTITAANALNGSPVGSDTKTFTLTVTPVSLTPSVTASDKVYDGTTAATVTGSLSGIFSGDTVSLTVGSANFSDKNVGNGKTVTASSLSLGGSSAGNYTLAQTSATTTASITAAPLTVTADAQAKIYGAADPALTYKITAGALGTGDTVASVFTGALARVPGENVGAYAINQNGLSAGSNYNLSYVGANLSITPTPLTVTADAKSAVYGAGLPAFTASYSGFKFSDGPSVLGGTLSFTSTASANSGVGTYAISPGGLTSSNYTITFANGSLAITKAPLTVTADNKTMVYGSSALPTLTATISGFVNNETLATSGVSGSAALSTTANATSPVSGYPITAALGSLTAANYTFQTFVPGTLSVTIASQTITWPSQSGTTQTVGVPLTLTATASSGLAVSYTCSDPTAASFAVNGSVTTVTFLKAGTWVITANQGGNSNYSAAAPFLQTFTVKAATQAPQTITFNPLAPVTVGAAPFALTATTSSGLAVTYTSGNTAVAKISGNMVTVLAAGTAVITANQAGNANFLPATPVSQTLTVNPAGKPHNITGIVFFDTNYDGDFDCNQTCQDAYTCQMGCNSDGWGGYGSNQCWSSWYSSQWGYAGSYSNQLCGNNNNYNFGWGGNNYGYGSGGNNSCDSESSHTCDYGLVGITVQLLNAANQIIATTVTNAKGGYTFANIMPGSYFVLAVANPGLKATTPNDVAVTVAKADVTVVPIGFSLDFSAIQKLPASCKTQSYWCSNLQGGSSGWNNYGQSNSRMIANYTNAIGNLCTGVYGGISTQSAYSLLSTRSSNCSDQLAASLLAAEYNYAAGCYISGDSNLTYALIWWGECVLTNPSQYSSSYQAWAMKWFDAFNNCTGKPINGPSPTS